MIQESVAKNDLVWVIDWSCQIKPGLILEVNQKTLECKILVKEKIEIFAGEFLFPTKQAAEFALDLFNS